ncbi:MAG: hypothetical protein ABJC63_08320 [Gemmatimonadales bacterium]
MILTTYGFISGRNSVVVLSAIATMAAVTMPVRTVPPLRGERRLCTLQPGTALALIRVEQDTTLPFAATDVERISGSGVRPSPVDSLLATASTPMPAARVRVLQLDPSSRAILASNGVTASQPIAFIRAAPFRGDCKTIVWADTAQFAARGEVGYVRATLAQPEAWIDGVPVLVISEVWNYPYPRRRALASGVARNAPLASAEAIFSLNSLLEMPRSPDMAARLTADSARRTRAIAWAVANPSAAELEPARKMLRRAVLDPDWEVARNLPSRLRGTYRVDVEVSGERSTWFFRTHDRPGYVWNAGDSLQATAQLLASPHVLGYQLVGYAAASRDSVSSVDNSGPVRAPLVWLRATDRPTVVGNETRRALSAVLEFTLSGAPERLWTDLEAFVPPSSVIDSALLARLNRPLSRAQKQPRIPLTIHVDARGGVRGDTTLLAGARSLRVVIERVDTLSIRRPF